MEHAQVVDSCSLRDCGAACRHDCLEYLELDNASSAPALERTFLAGYPGMTEADRHSARAGPAVLRGRFTVADANVLSRKFLTAPFSMPIK